MGRMVTSILPKAILLLFLSRLLPTTETPSPPRSVEPLNPALFAPDQAPAPPTDLAEVIRVIAQSLVALLVESARYFISFFRDSHFYSLPLVVQAGLSFVVLGSLRVGIVSIEGRVVKRVLELDFGKTTNAAFGVRELQAFSGGKDAGGKVGWSWKRVNMLRYRAGIFIADYWAVVFLVIMVGCCVVGVARSVWVDRGVSAEQRGGRRVVDWLILIDCLDTALQLLQPIKHLLPLEFLPKRIVLSCRWKAVRLDTYASSGPSNDSSQPTRGRRIDHKRTTIKLSTHHLLTVALTTLSSTLALAQFLLLIIYAAQQLLTQSLTSTMIRLDSPVSDSMLAVVVAMTLQSISGVIEGELGELRRVVGCLWVVGTTFPVSTKKLEGEEESSRVSELWICTICFNGVASDTIDDSTCVGDGESISESSENIPSDLCQLRCGHRYHSTCLVDWLHYQSFCPSCRATIKIPAFS